jgi:hypothetical protein
MTVFKMPFTMKLEWKVPDQTNPKQKFLYCQSFEKLKGPKEFVLTIPN